ncbi:hypothetical protein LZZ85_08675 [Terrimonas sp. NA20]|uniref:Lipocalin-like domain-containing protein n=1 Tax=Terrimonas ginsenosidimutans TaxID=2908004 RepID=A0ABS9KPW7_9BACT|nr:hypothetical protein [Terrimonas ginsenosidimutans]MCG2614354.1 hypothetical protein [Terrimonas ginsenosidimutans]
MKTYLLMFFLIAGILNAGCNKNNCDCAPPPPPLANTAWKMVNYSGGLAGVNVDLPPGQQHTLSFAFYEFTATTKPSGQQTSGRFSFEASLPGYQDALVIKFDKPVLTFGTGNMIVLKNRNDSLVLAHNVTDGLTYTFTRL